MKKTLHFLIFVFIFSLSSCADLDMNKLNKEVEIGTSLVIPVGHTRATALDLISMIDNDNFGNWLADTEGNFVYLLLNTILNLPADTCKTFDLSVSGTNGYSFKNEANFWLVNDSLFGNFSPHSRKPKITKTFDYGYNKDDHGRITQRLDEVTIAGAKLNVTVDLEDITIEGANTLYNYIEVLFRFPRISTEVHSIKIYQSDGNRKSAVFNIGDAKIEFSDKSTTDIEIEANFHTASTATNKIKFGANSDIKISAKKTEINVSEAWGYFNNYERVTGDRIYEEIPVNLFGNIFAENRLLFHNPQIVFEVSNNIGVPLSFWIDSIKAVDADGAVCRANFNGSVSAEIPMGVSANIGEMATKTIVFDRENGGTHQLFQINPKRFIYDFHVAINHNIADAQWNQHKPHFISRPLKVDMDVKAFLRFWFDKNTKYASQSTIELSGTLGDLINFKDENENSIVEIEPERISINIDFKNHIPLKMVTNVVFVDENNVELFRKAGFEIECPDVDAEGYVLAEKVFTLKIPFDSENMEKLLKTKSIVIGYTATARDFDNDRINIRATDYLDAVVSLFIKGKFGIDLGNILGQ